MVFHYRRKENLSWGRYHALLIGVDKYKEKLYRSLPAAANDVRQLANILGRYDYQVTLLTHLRFAENRRPTREAILTALAESLESHMENDLFLVYFGGHGVMSDDEKDKNKKTAYLLPADVRATALPETAINLDAFKGEILKSKAQIKILLLDACHSGSARCGSDQTDFAMSPEFEKHIYMEATGSVTLASCRQGEVAYEIKNQHGVFSHFIIKGLKGEALEAGKPYVTFSSLAAYVTDKVKGWAERAGTSQHPNYKGALEGDPPLADIGKWKKRIRVRYCRTAVGLVIALMLILAAFFLRRGAEVRSLVEQSVSILSKDNRLAMSYAAEAYKKSLFGVAPSVNAALSAAAASTLDRPLPGQELPHKKFVHNIVFSSTGAYILTACDDGAARLWNMNGAKIRTFSHRAAVFSAIFIAGDESILTRSDENSAKLWDLNGATLAAFGHGRRISVVQYSMPANRVLTASEDGQAHVWDLNGSNLAALEGHKGAVSHAMFSPDGDKIFTCGDDYTARLWGIHGKQIAIIGRHRSHISHALFSPDGTTIFIATQRELPVLYNLQGTPIICFDMIKNFSTAAFSPDGAVLLLADRDGSLFSWNRYSGNPPELIEKSRDIIVRLVYSHKGGGLARVYNNGEIRFQDLIRNHIWRLKTHAGIADVAFSPDDRMLAAASVRNTVRIWSIEEQFTQFIRRESTGLHLALLSPASPDIMILPAAKPPVLTLPSGQVKSVFYRIGKEKEIINAAFASDGKKILTISADARIRIWSDSGTLLKILKKHGGDIYSAVFSPDGTSLASCCADGAARIWSIQNGLLFILRHENGAVYDAVYSPTGAEILTAGDAFARLWSNRGVFIRDFHHPHGSVFKVFFTDGGRRLLTVASTIREWSREGRLLHEWSVPGAPVSAYAFSSRQDRLACACSDNEIRVYRPDGLLETHFAIPNMKITSLCFSVDGEQLLSASSDGAAILWRLPSAIYKKWNEFCKTDI